MKPYTQGLLQAVVTSWLKNRQQDFQVLVPQPDPFQSSYTQIEPPKVITGVGDKFVAEYPASHPVERPLNKEYAGFPFFHNFYEVLQNFSYIICELLNQEAKRNHQKQESKWLNQDISILYDDLDLMFFQMQKGVALDFNPDTTNVYGLVY
jgi:hypothetical protein